MYKRQALGYYGRTSAPVDPEVQKLCAEKMGKDPITCRPADLIKPGIDVYKRQPKERREGLQPNPVPYSSRKPPLLTAR